MAEWRLGRDCMDLGRFLLSVGYIVQDAEADVFREAEIQLFGLGFNGFPLG